MVGTSGVAWLVGNLQVSRQLLQLQSTTLSGYCNRFIPRLLAQEEESRVRALLTDAFTGKKIPQLVSKITTNETPVTYSFLTPLHHTRL